MSESTAAAGQDGYVGIDVGTSQVKVGVFACSGELLGHSSARASGGGTAATAEYDPEQTWQATAQLVREALRVSAVGRVRGVGVCGQGDGCVLLGPDGVAVGPAISWTDDRAAPIVSAWHASGALEDYARQASAPLFPGSTVAVAAWLERERPGLIRRARTMLLCKDWIRYRLTGELGTDWSDGYALFADGADRPRAAIRDVLGVTSPQALLPQPRRPADLAGRVTSQAAGQTGLAEGTPVVTGAMDVTAAAVGVGLRPGEGFTVLGTTAIHAVLGAAADGESSPGVFGVPYPEAGLQLRGVAPAAATTNLDWVARTCWPGREDGVADALRDAARVPVGSGGLIFHPYLSPGGERGPFVNAAARAQFFGLTAAHDRSHLARAVLEGVAFAGRESYLAIGGVPSELVISGGGAASELWCRIFADVVGTRVVVSETADSGCRGAAAIAARGVEGSPRLAGTMTARTLCRVYEPDPAVDAFYQQLFQIFVDLRYASAPRWEALARLVHPL